MDGGPHSNDLPLHRIRIMANQQSIKIQIVDSSIKPNSLPNFKRNAPSASATTDVLSATNNNKSPACASVCLD